MCWCAGKFVAWRRRRADDPDGNPLRREVGGGDLYAVRMNRPGDHDGGALARGSDRHDGRLCEGRCAVLVRRIDHLHAEEAYR